MTHSPLRRVMALLGIVVLVVGLIVLTSIIVEQARDRIVSTAPHSAEYIEVAGVEAPAAGALNTPV